MNAGRLDRRITFQSKTSTRDAVGGFVESWSNYASRWGSHRPLKITAEISGDMKDRIFYGEGDTVFVIRYDDQINSNMRIEYDGRIYSIEGVREFGMERQAYMEISAKAKS